MSGIQRTPFYSISAEEQMEFEKGGFRPAVWLSDLSRSSVELLQTERWEKRWQNDLEVVEFSQFRGIEKVKVASLYRFLNFYPSWSTKMKRYLCHAYIGSEKNKIQEIISSLLKMKETLPVEDPDMPESMKKVERDYEKDVTRITDLAYAALERVDSQEEQSLSLTIMEGIRPLKITETACTTVKETWSLDWKDTKRIWNRLDKLGEYFKNFSKHDQEKTLDLLDKLSIEILLNGRGRRDFLQQKIQSVRPSLSKKEDVHLPQTSTEVDFSLFLEIMKNHSSVLTCDFSLKKGFEVEEKSLTLEDFLRDLDQMYFALEEEFTRLDAEMILCSHGIVEESWDRQFKKVQRVLKSVENCFTWIITTIPTEIKLSEINDEKENVTSFSTSVYSELSPEFRSDYLKRWCKTIQNQNTRFDHLNKRVFCLGKTASKELGRNVFLL